MGARERVPVGREDVYNGGAGRAPQGVAVGAREKLFTERDHVYIRGRGGTPRGAEVVAFERMSVGPKRVRGGGV